MPLSSHLAATIRHERPCVSGIMEPVGGTRQEFHHPIRQKPCRRHLSGRSKRGKVMQAEDHCAGAAAGAAAAYTSVIGALKRYRKPG